MVRLLILDVVLCFNGFSIFVMSVIFFFIVLICLFRDLWVVDFEGMVFSFVSSCDR